jgi:HD-GYP domain-containing protein (c-di-GMP phosphodiesterase class II)
MGLWSRSSGAIPMEPSQLAIGIYVWLDLNWTEHPFLANRFLIKTDKDIAIIQSLDCKGRLYFFPDKGKPALPVVVQTTAIAEDAAQNLAQEALAREVVQLAKAKKDQLWQQKDAEARTRKAWETAANGVRDALANMSSSPKVAGEQIRQVSGDTAATVAQGKEVFFQLVANADTPGPQFHALNTMILSVMVGKKAGLSQAQLADLAMAALAHDAGKSQVPQHILKNAHRKKHEEDFYQQHVHHSVKLATLAGTFSASALAMIADHHETLDGKGWPNKKTDLSAGTRILALVNRYERLCSPEAPAREALTPAEALAQLFRQESGKYDAGLLSIMVKLLGVYPPGTLVQLSDESFGLVIAPGPNSLQPKVLIYRPELPKDEAPFLSLATQTDVKISAAVRPGKLQPEVLDWLDPQQRLAYFFNSADA